MNGSALGEPSLGRSQLRGQTLAKETTSWIKMSVRIQIARAW